MSDKKPETNCIYEIEYHYSDEDEFHNCYVCVYDSSKVGAGETIAYTLKNADEDGDYSGLDKLLYNLFGLGDESICFYYDIQDAVWDLKTSLERCYDIVIKDMWVERSAK